MLATMKIEVSAARIDNPPRYRRRKSESGKNFQPGQIEREPDADRPGQNFVVVDVVGEANWIERFDHAGVNEKAADDKIDNAPNNIAAREVHFTEQTPNAQRPTPNAQWQKQTSDFIIERWALSVGRFLHLLVLSHSSQPPWSTNTFCIGG